MNRIYPSYKTFLLTAAANVSLDQDTVTDGPYCALINVGIYTYSNSHSFYSDLTGIIGTDQRISTPTVINGTFDGDDLLFPSVTGNIGAIVIYRRNSGANTTWKLVAYRDSTSGTVVANNDNVPLTWSVSGIFTL